MRALLDTHALLWWLTDDARLSRAARTAVANSDVLVSTVCLWEIEIKRSLGKLDGDVGAIVREVGFTEGFSWLDVRPGHVLALAELMPHHRDPFDRMLVAQCKHERATLITRDGALERYEVETLW